MKSESETDTLSDTPTTFEEVVVNVELKVCELPAKSVTEMATAFEPLAQFGCVSIVTVQVVSLKMIELPYVGRKSPPAMIGLPPMFTDSDHGSKCDGELTWNDTVAESETPVAPLAGLRLAIEGVVASNARLAYGAVP
jgi:hypothetical protein